MAPHCNGRCPLTHDGPQYYKFVVDEEPYCVWDWELAQRTKAFLNQVDPAYFEYLAEAHRQGLTGEHRQQAALAMRAAYAQALETLFAFLGAALQAPYCAPAWLTKYRAGDLRSILTKIEENKPIYSLLGYRAISWTALADLVHQNLVFEDRAKDRRVRDSFAQAWRRFAWDLLSEGTSKEYNSIKHGLRATPGGFGAAIGVPDQPGTGASPDRMRVITDSEFGSSFLEEGPISPKVPKRHFRFHRKRLNWNPENMACGLVLIAVSLNNILSWLKILNGAPAEQVQFRWPTDEETFTGPWQTDPDHMNLTAMTGPDIPMHHSQIEVFSQEAIRSAYGPRRPDDP